MTKRQKRSSRKAMKNRRLWQYTRRRAWFTHDPMYFWPTINLGKRGPQ